MSPRMPGGKRHRTREALMLRCRVGTGASVVQLPEPRQGSCGYRNFTTQRSLQFCGNAKGASNGQLG
jgi:hypothetical protein